MIQASSQLIEAVQQKVSLSQQLEECQVNLEMMLDNQVQDKLEENKKRKTSKTKYSDNSKVTIDRNNDSESCLQVEAKLRD